MPKFRGYCLPLESAVEFDVDAVNRLETNRGIKWQVTGTYEGYRLSVFTNETNGLNLKEELDSQPIIFDAEISYLTAEEAPFMTEEIPIVEPPETPLSSGSGDIEFVVDIPKSPKKQRRPPHCSKCGEQGHNKRTCGRHKKKAEEILEAEPPTREGETTELPILFKIFVPSTKAGNEVISEKEFSQRIKVTEDFLTMLFGGKTTTIGTGNYEMKQGGWADETVAIVEAYATAEAYEKSRDILEAYIEGKLNDWEQESIGYVFEDESLFLFGAEDEEIVEYEPDITIVGDIPVNTNSYVVPKKLYYEMMDLLPDTVSTTETTDGTCMILGFFDFDADIVTSIANLPPLDPPDYSFSAETFSAEEKQSFFHADGEVMNRGDYLRNIDQFHDADEFTDLPDGTIAVKRAESYEGDRLSSGHWAGDFMAEDEGKTRTFKVLSVDYETDGKVDNDDLPQEFTLTLDSSDIEHLEEMENIYGDEWADYQMQEIADLIVDTISDESGWLVQGFYFEELMPDGSLKSFGAESFEADEWTPTEEEVDFIQSVSYQNVLEHGEAQIGSVMARMPQRFDMSEVGRYLGKYVGASVKNANSMMQEDGEEAVKLALIELDPSLMERLAPKKKIATVREFPDLPNVTQGKFRVRFAPNPNAPLTVGHMRGVLINNYYADKYDGEFVLRFDDTSTDIKPPLLEAYKMIPEDIEWLTGKKPDEIIKASDRLDLYYDRAKELISLGGAYFCTCAGGDFKVLKDSGKPCPHRDQSVEENLKEFDALINGVYRPGEAVLRAKTDLKAPNPALRDFVLFRTQEKSHPLVGDKYPCWPLLDFQSAIDDHELDITHIIRGVDLMDSTRKQKLLYDIFGWEYPEVAYWGRVKIFDEDGTEIKFSSSEYAKGVKSGKYSGWDDPRLFTVRGMRAKGYLPQALLNWWLEFGLTQKNISVPMTTLNTLNRREMGAESEIFGADLNISEEDCEKYIKALRKIHIGVRSPDDMLWWEGVIEDYVKPALDELGWNSEPLHPHHQESYDEWQSAFEEIENIDTDKGCGKYIYALKEIQAQVISPDEMLTYDDIGETIKSELSGLGWETDALFGDEWEGWVRNYVSIHRAEEENPFGLSKGEREELEASKRVRHGTLHPPKSFKDWSYEEEFEHDHPNFSQWVREEVDEHGDPLMSIWGREEMMENRHKDAEEDDDWDEDEEYDADETYLPKTTTLVTALGLGAIAAYFAPAQIREFFKKLKN